MWMEQPQVSVQGKVEEEGSGDVDVEEGEAQHREGSSTKKIPSCRRVYLQNLALKHGTRFIHKKVPGIKWKYHC